MIQMYPNELYHHGIMGQRWGKKNGPPYPLSRSQKSKKEKQEAKRTTPLTDGEKSNLIRRGTASEAYAAREYLTVNEMETIMNRINTEKKLSSLASKDLVSTFDQIDKLMTKVGKVKNWSEIAFDFYKLFNDVLKEIENPGSAPRGKKK